MTIKKGDVTVFEAPNWLVCFGVWAIHTMVVDVVNIACNRKKKEVAEITETIDVSSPEEPTE